MAREPRLQNPGLRRSDLSTAAPRQDFAATWQQSPHARSNGKHTKVSGIGIDGPIERRNRYSSQPARPRECEDNMRSAKKPAERSPDVWCRARCNQSIHRATYAD